MLFGDHSIIVDDNTNKNHYKNIIDEDTDSDIYTMIN